MKGILLAGGTGSRLRPATTVTNKHLLPIYNKPMVLFPLETLVQAGVTDITLITGPEHCGAFVELLKSGNAYGCNLSYRVQEKAGGIAEALGIAHTVVGDSNCMVILGDNIYEPIQDLQETVKEFDTAMTTFAGKAIVYAKKVPDPHRFGIVEFDADGKAISIEEKPTTPKSKYAVTGLYIYDNAVFDVVKKLKPSGRGELEISDVNSHYLHNGVLTVKRLGENHFWSDAGTPESLWVASSWYRSQVLEK